MSEQSLLRNFVLPVAKFSPMMVVHLSKGLNKSLVEI